MLRFVQDRLVRLGGVRLRGDRLGRGVRLGGVLLEMVPFRRSPAAAAVVVVRLLREGAV